METYFLLSGTCENKSQQRSPQGHEPEVASRSRTEPRDEERAGDASGSSGQWLKVRARQW